MIYIKKIIQKGKLFLKDRFSLLLESLKPDTYCHILKRLDPTVI